MIVEKPYKDTDEVCTCTGLTAGHIRELVENGAASIEEILEQTGAGTICGECTGVAVAVAREFLRMQIEKAIVPVKNCSTLNAAELEKP